MSELFPTVIPLSIYVRKSRNRDIDFKKKSFLGYIYKNARAFIVDRHTHNCGILRDRQAGRVYKKKPSIFAGLLKICLVVIPVLVFDLYYIFDIYPLVAILELNLFK